AADLAAPIAIAADVALAPAVLVDRAREQADARLLLDARAGAPAVGLRAAVRGAGAAGEAHVQTEGSRRAVEVVEARASHREAGGADVLRAAGEREEQGQEGSWVHGGRYSPRAAPAHALACSTGSSGGPPASSACVRSGRAIASALISGAMARVTPARSAKVRP